MKKEKKKEKKKVFFLPSFAAATREGPLKKFPSGIVQSTEVVP